LEDALLACIGNFFASLQPDFQQMLEMSQDPRNLKRHSIVRAIWGRRRQWLRPDKTFQTDHLL